MVRIEEINYYGERRYALYIDGKHICTGNMNAVNLCLALRGGAKIKIA